MNNYQPTIPNTHRIFPSTIEDHTMVPRPHETFSRIDHLLNHKTNLSKLKRIKIIENIFSKHDRTMLEIKRRKKF